MANLETASIKAPGFAGLNTQDSPLDQPMEFAAIADNCVIDQYGRVAARKGYNVLTASGAPANGVDNIGFYRSETGVTQVYSCADDGIYTGTTTMTNSYSTGITAGNFQMVQLDNNMIFVQENHDPLIASEGNAPALLSPTVDTLGGNIDQPNIALAAFGRLWLAGTNQFDNVLWASDLLIPGVFNAGSAARFNLDDVWPDGKDQITGLAAHNGFLIIFGRKSIIVYRGPEDPATMSVSDTVAGIGCVARDSIQSAGNDLLFLSALGVQSFGRTIQEESLPSRDISGNVRDDLILRIGNNNATVKSVYSPEEGFYALFFQDTLEAFIFDMRQKLPTGFARATFWPNSPFTCMVRQWNNNTLFVGGAQGVGTYENFLDNGQTYQMRYYTHYNDWGATAKLKMLKKVRPIIINTSELTAVIKWSYDFSGRYGAKPISFDAIARDEYGLGEYGIAEWGAGTTLNLKHINANGSGTYVDVGIEVDVNGSEFSVQEITMYATLGRTAW